MAAMSESAKPHIVVMGVGNILLRDEGVGVRALQRLEREYVFPDHVELVDGGVLALNLMAVLERADRLILLDAVRGGGEPGEIYVFDWDEVPPRVRYKDSIHQIDFVETMSVLPLIAEPPKTTVIGVEPESIEDWDLGLSPPVAASLDRVIELAIEELDKLGVRAAPRDEAAPPPAI